MQQVACHGRREGGAAASIAGGLPVALGRLSAKNTARGSDAAAGRVLLMQDGRAQEAHS